MKKSTIKKYNNILKQLLIVMCDYKKKTRWKNLRDVRYKMENVWIHSGRS